MVAEFCPPSLGLWTFTFWLQIPMMITTGIRRGLELLHQGTMMKPMERKVHLADHRGDTRERMCPWLIRPTTTTMRSWALFTSLYWFSQSNDYLPPESVLYTVSYFLIINVVYCRMKMMMKLNLRCIEFKEHWESGLLGMKCGALYQKSSRTFYSHMWIQRMIMGTSNMYGL